MLTFTACSLFRDVFTLSAQEPIKPAEHRILTLRDPSADVTRHSDVSSRSSPSSAAAAVRLCCMHRLWLHGAAEARLSPPSDRDITMMTGRFTISWSEKPLSCDLTYRDHWKWYNLWWSVSEILPASAFCKISLRHSEILIDRHVKLSSHLHFDT